MIAINCTALESGLFPVFMFEFSERRRQNLAHENMAAPDESFPERTNARAGGKFHEIQTINTKAQSHDRENKILSEKLQALCPVRDN